MPIIAKVYFSHPDMALANVVTTFPDVTIRVLQEVSTAPVSDNSFFVVETDRIEALERAFAADHTVSRADLVSRYQDWPVYSVEFSSEALLLGSVVTEHRGFALDAHQHDGGWIERWQLPDRETLRSVWQYADAQSFTFDILKIRRVSDSSNSNMFGITDKQRSILIYAYENGYFEQPSETTLEEIADHFDISTTAASGRIRRAVRTIIESVLPEVE